MFNVAMASMMANRSKLSTRPTPIQKVFETEENVLTDEKLFVNKFGTKISPSSEVYGDIEKGILSKYTKNFKVNDLQDLPFSTTDIVKFENKAFKEENISTNDDYVEDKIFVYFDFEKAKELYKNKNFLDKKALLEIVKIYFMGCPMSFIEKGNFSWKDKFHYDRFINGNIQTDYKSNMQNILTVISEFILLNCGLVKHETTHLYEIVKELTDIAESKGQKNMMSRRTASFTASNLSNPVISYTNANKIYRMIDTYRYFEKSTKSESSHKSYKITKLGQNAIETPTMSLGTFYRGLGFVSNVHDYGHGESFIEKRENIIKTLEAKGITKNILPEIFELLNIDFIIDTVFNLYKSYDNITTNELGKSFFQITSEARELTDWYSEVDDSSDTNRKVLKLFLNDTEYKKFLTINVRYFPGDDMSSRDLAKFILLNLMLATEGNTIPKDKVDMVKSFNIMYCIKNPYKKDEISTSTEEQADNDETVLHTETVSEEKINTQVLDDINDHKKGPYSLIWDIDLSKI